MPRQRKIVRTKRLYKKYSVNKQALNMVYYALVIIILIGVGYIVSLEWSKRFGPNAPSSLPPSSVPSAVTPSEPISSEESSNSSVIIEPPVSMSGLKALTMPTELLNGQNDAAVDAFLSKAKTDGYNAVYVELKTADGKIHYKTTNEMAAKLDAVATNAVDINWLAGKIKDAALTPVATMRTLKDPSAHVKHDNSYCYNESLTTNWLDNSVKLGGKPWLNPYMDNARNYIAALTKEMSEAGFKTILLSDVIFPDKNTRSMGLVNQTKPYSEILAQVLSEAAAAAGDAQVFVLYTSEQFIGTINNPYLVSAKDIGYKQAGVIIDKTSITRVLGTLKDTLDKGLSEVERQNAAVKVLLDKAVADVGVDIFPVVEDKELLAAIEPTLALYNFKNIFTGGK